MPRRPTGRYWRQQPFILEFWWRGEERGLPYSFLQTTKCTTSFWHPVLCIFCWCCIVRDDASEVCESLYHVKWMSINVDIRRYVRRPRFGWWSTSVFFKVIVRPKALAAWEKRLTITWRASSMWTRRAQSSENSSSRTTTSKVTFCTSQKSVQIKGAAVCPESYVDPLI